MIIQSITVRMYRQILGDCFLIILAGGDGDTSRILIDCGVLQGTPGGKARMRKIVAHIFEEKDSKLDLVIVTHEHHDHISGFQYAEEIFEEKKFDNLWFAWTEDPVDGEGIRLQERFAKKHAKLAEMATALNIETAEDSPARGAADEAVRRMGLAGFSGPLDGHSTGVGADAERLRGSKKIYANLRRWATRTDYLSPGQVWTTPGMMGLTTYVLGPPRNGELLMRSNPASGEDKQTYLAIDETAGGGADDDTASPFPRRYQWRDLAELAKGNAVGGNGCELPNPQDVAATLKWIKEHYFDPKAPCRYGQTKPHGHDCNNDFVCGLPQKYRQIDSARIEDFYSLALRMDNDTNNSSLVLAFELPDDQGTMIFAADAQVGNWESWEKVEFAKNGEPVGITTADLLKRAKLYKVGHHGSHNATLRQKGLELMVDGDLIAMIPTDAAFALQQSKGWLMPNPTVDAALKLRTNNRILRGDRDREETIAAHEKAFRDNSGAAPDPRFGDRIREEQDLYIEYVVFERG